MGIKENSSEALLARLQNGDSFTVKQKLMLAFKLALPAMLAQISTIIMEYIDASMVGHLGANATASIGLVATTTWLFGGITMAATMGFTIQTAQKIGAKDDRGARSIMKQGLAATLLYTLILTLIATLISRFLPGWLSSDTELHRDAFSYFLILMLSLPAHQMKSIAGGMLQASGDMKTPSILNVLACFLDVVFNALLIFPSGTFGIDGVFSLPGAGLGVPGAALGTAITEVIIAGTMLLMLLFRSKPLHLRKNEPLIFNRNELKMALKLAIPVGVEQVLMCGAYIMSTVIVAPLGSIAIASHSLSITAESLCYMPGYGIAAAASTMIGQSIGAKRPDLARSLAWMNTGLGVAFMTCTGVLMYIFAPQMIGLLSPVPEIQELGTAVLRIEAFAEPLYAASIVANGAFRGAGDTFVPSIMNFGSMWLVRLPLSWYLSAPMGMNMGLRGVWIAMCIELCARGTVFLIRLSGKRWMKKIA
ncbi:MAG: MATE family efflux transporter [Proteobacteria bacterium]|nr:MATE family efflux transporter [Pseudomonadota bacterium]